MAKPPSNPFKYGVVVKGEDLADRQAELAQLVRDLRDRQRLFLISPRRFGKTSLIMSALEKLQQEGALTVYLDLYRAPSLEQFLEYYATELARAGSTTLESLRKTVVDLFSSLRPKLSLDPQTGAPELGLDLAASERLPVRAVRTVFDAAQAVAERRRKLLVIAFDEFQEITVYNGEAIEKAIRGAIQHHDRVGYLFAGSKHHLLEEMITSPGRPFYAMGPALHLPPIPRAEFVPFLKERFRNTGFTLEEGVIECILDLTHDVPYNAQYLCHELWDEWRANRVLRVQDVDAGLTRLVERQTPQYLQIWDGLTPPQRLVLQAIAASGGEGIFSNAFRRAHRLGSPSTVQRALDGLVKKDLLDRAVATGNQVAYRFVDVFFGAWVNRIIGPAGAG
jgi:hypothetical protein